MLKLPFEMKKLQKFRFILLIALYLLAQVNCLVHAQEKHRKIIPIGNLAVMGTYSQVLGGSDLSGVYVAGNFAPVIRLSPRDYFIPLYNGLYRRQKQIINEEEGARLYTTIMSHNFSCMYKHLFSEQLIQRFTTFVSLNFNKETSDESFGDGLYDYRDYGVNLDYQWNLIETDNQKGILLLGSKYFFRKYPNFKTLISLAQQTAPEEDEKDQNVWGLTSRYTHTFTKKLILSLSYDFFYKHFTDKHTIDPNGILEDKKRNDSVHIFNLNGNYKPSNNLILELTGEIELNNSNQNLYDTLETPLVLKNDVFVPHYFNYTRYQIQPSLTYLFSLRTNKNIIVKISYSFTIKDYSHRNVKDEKGNYKSELQEDRIHVGSFNVDFPLTHKLSFLINAEYIHNISNMEFEQFYRYDYDIYNILSGFSYRF
jgi:hypothetical protein